MNIDFKNVSKHYAARTHEKMQEVLMDPQGIGPAIICPFSSTANF